MALAATIVPAHLLAGAGPFERGSSALVPVVLTILTPIAAIAVMAMGAAALVGKISWWWVIGAVLGIVLVFGAPQIVAYVRSLFGV